MSPPTIADEILWSGQYPFEGTVEFPLGMRLLGFAEPMRARVVYEAQPDWEHFDVNEQVLVPNGARRFDVLYRLETLAPPVRPSASPEWAEWEIELPNHIWDAVLDAIEDDCKRQDRERRQKHGIKASKPSRQSPDKSLTRTRR